MSFRFLLACLFVVLISTLVLAQSDRAPFGKRPNGLATAQEQHSGVPTNPSLMPQGPSFTQRRTRASKSSALLSSSSQASGLNFAPAVAYDSGGGEADSVAVADVNGDGRPDIVVVNDACSTNCSSGSVGVLLGNGDGTFQTAVTYTVGAQATAVAVADVNGDGKLDIVAVSRCDIGSNECVDGMVWVLLGNGDGTFQAPVAYASGGDAPGSVG